VAAALVNEIKVLAHPASIDSIPTSAGMEDFVSMGATSALKLRQALDLAYRVIAIELLLAAQGLDFRAPLKPGRGVAEALAAVRHIAPTLRDDRPPAPDIEALAAAVRAGLLDDLAPESALMEAPHRPRRSHAAQQPAERGERRQPREQGADRAGRGRH